MLPEIKFTITDRNKTVESYNQSVDFQHFYEALNKFESKLNATITKLIEDSGDSCGDCNIDEEIDDSEDEDKDELTSPKKKRKN